jgi:hypothetical protein
VVAGLTALTHVYGFVAVLIGLLAIAIRRPVQRGLVKGSAFLGAAFACAAPWFVRNAVRLHDPVYPLGTPPFHGRALDNPMFTASKTEISHNATWYWKGTPVNAMRAQQLATALYDRHLLVVGVGLGLFVGILLALRGDRRIAWLVISVVMIVAILLAPGWYWIRGLITLVPLAAILGGVGLAVLWNAAGRRWVGWSNAPPWLSRVGRSVIVLVLAAAVLVASGIAVALAFAGPNQATWTTGLKGKDDLLAGVRVLGAPKDDIRLVFRDDARAWDWLNSHTAAGDRVATFDIRLYYFDRPESLFYLDGREALPLLGKADPEAVRSFLAARGVRYVFVPPWVDAAVGSRHPGVDLLPLSNMLGGPQFPLVRSFGTPDWSSRIYEVSGPIQSGTGP